MIMSLNGSDWLLEGWNKHQWHYEIIMETGGFSIPLITKLPATVPGSVQTDLMRAGKLEDWRDDANFLHNEWVEHREWVYYKDFALAEKTDKRYFLDFQGLDFHGFVYLNNKQIASFGQMHLPLEVEVTEDLIFGGSNQLKIIFLQPPEVDGQVGYTSRTSVLKSRFNYGWDWCPRLVNIGIFGDVTLIGTGSARIKDFYPQTSDDGSIDIELQLDGQAEKAEYEVTYNGRVVAECECKIGEKQFVRVDNPLIWDVNNGKKQPVYTITARVIDSCGKTDCVTKQIGFRRIEYKVPEGVLPDSYPYQLCVNGKNIMTKGVNWVPISPFYGTVREEDYRYHLGQLAQMNINLVRVWGGALLESECFYNVCDEMGILVWQEFPQSSSGIDNTPCTDEAFIRELGIVAESFILRRRHHPSLAVWCAGNELYWEDYRPVNTDISTNVMLGEKVKKLDSGRLYLPGSPSGRASGFKKENAGKGIHGDVHGPWGYMPGHYEYFNIEDSMLNSEVGTGGTARLETLEKHCKGFKLWPPTEENPFWYDRTKSWMNYRKVFGLFGEFDGENRGIRQFCASSRYIQAESLGYVASIIRRHYYSGTKTGVIFWMGNESFPNNANGSVMEYDGCPKPAFYKIKNAFAPVMAALKYDRVHLDEAGELCAELFVCSDEKTALNRLRLTAYDECGSVLLEKEYADVETDGVRVLEKLHIPVAEPFTLVKIEGEGIYNEYILTAGGTCFGAITDSDKTGLEIKKDDARTFRITNNSDKVSAFVCCVAYDELGRALVINNNVRSLCPGESFIVTTDKACSRIYIE